MSRATDILRMAEETLGSQASAASPSSGAAKDKSLGKRHQYGSKQRVSAPRKADDNRGKSQDRS